MLEPTRAATPAAIEALRTLRRPPPIPSDPQRKAGLRAEWRRVARLLSDPAVELDGEQVVAVFDVFRRLKAIGDTIDPMAEALIMQMAFQLSTSDAFLDG